MLKAGVGIEALTKNFDFDMDITDRDYKKFRSDTKSIPPGEAGVQ